MPKTLILDGYNLLHRARSGFNQGDYAIAYNFLRAVKALVDQFKPNRVLLVTEGVPKQRLAAYPDYKGNRKVKEGSAAQTSLVDFRRQKDFVLELIAKHFPISVLNHPDHEADDVIYNVILRSSRIEEFVVVSSDSDFTQLVEEFDERVKVYNPIKKSFVAWDKNVSYVTYKALKGDVSDNIKGIKGIGETRAMRLADKAGLELSHLKRDADIAQQFTLNLELVKFITWTDKDRMLMTSSSPSPNWDAVRDKLNEWDFKSITNDKSWKKFVATFDPLFSVADRIFGALPPAELVDPSTLSNMFGMWPGDETDDELSDVLDDDA